MSARRSARQTAFDWRRLAPDIEPLRESPAFRCLYLARTVSLLSISILAVAVAWQVYGLSGSSLHVAGVTVGLAAGTLTGLVWGGVLADRVDRKRLMIQGRAGYVVVVCLLWANSLRAEPGLLEIYLATLLSGLSSGFSMPALMAALPRLLPLRHLAAAGALNALAMELGRLVGPLVAGALLAHSSLTVCYGIVLAGAALVPVLLNRLPAELLKSDSSVQPRVSLLRQWREGCRYLGSNHIIACLLALDLAMMLLVSIHTLMPQLADAVLQGGPRILGYLYAAPAAGALLIALSSGWTRTLRRPGRVVILCAILWGGVVVLAGVAVNGVLGGQAWGLWMLLVCLALSGMADTASDIVRGALLQIHTPDALRGRVSALWLFQGSLGPALGGVQAAGIAALWSPAVALILGGGLCAVLVGAAAAAPRSPLRKALWPLGVGEPKYAETGTGGGQESS